MISRVYHWRVECDGCDLVVTVEHGSGERSPDVPEGWDDPYEPGVRRRMHYCPECVKRKDGDK